MYSFMLMQLSVPTEKNMLTSNAEKNKQNKQTVMIKKNILMVRIFLSYLKYEMCLVTYTCLRLNWVSKCVSSCNNATSKNL